jgi:hypothetical protein
MFIAEEDGGRHFENECTFGEDSDSHLFVRCAFASDDTYPCNPECASCHIKEGEQNVEIDLGEGVKGIGSFHNTVECKRGNFTIGILINPDK